jgi:amino acid transporter
VTYAPIPSPFIRFGTEWVDGALGFGMWLRISLCA